MGNVQHLRWPLRLAGAGLLTATAAIHLDLYLTGYRTIPTIGWLFLLQVIATFALAVAVLAAPLLSPLAVSLAPRSPWLPAAAAAAGAGFALATLGGYLLSLWIGLFGFREIRTTAGVVAGIIEVAAFAVLTLLAVISLPTAAPAAPASPPSTVPAGRNAPAGAVATTVATTPARRADALRRFAVPGIAGLTAVAAIVLAASVATANGGSGGSAAATTAVLHTDSVNGVTVLTDSKGLTLYWFAPDTATTSACYGTCAAYWPPVYGTPSVASGVTGVTGKFGTIHRTDGTIQATYNGHPLYTYIGDTAPGQASGNNVDLNGGFWYEVRAA
jgi:predicted lipoprotein with Yx(FWY)xxD motif